MESSKKKKNESGTTSKKEQTEKRMRKTKERKESEGGMGSPIEGTGKGKLGTIDQKTGTSNRQLGRINRTEPSTGPGRIRGNLRKHYRKAVLLASDNNKNPVFVTNIIYANKLFHKKQTQQKGDIKYTWKRARTATREHIQETKSNRTKDRDNRIRFR